MKKKNIYIGVAWPYVNDVFHFGNLAGAYLPPDIFSRFHRLKGNEVLMVSGSDFHGTPITLRAEKEGKKPKEIAEKFHELNKKYLKEFRIDYDLYTSTHTDNHREMTQRMFLELLKNGFIKISETEQLYSEKSKKFLQDRYVEGECPFCGCPDARGDQCEKCGRMLDPLELKNPVSKIDKSELSKKKTENYFIDLKKLEKEIKKWLVFKENFRSWIKNEALGWIKEGLRERAITRDIDYGVSLPSKDIPEEKRVKNIENKRFYVWFEAVIGYLSAAIEYSQKIEKPDYWKNFFYDEEAETYYFVGQDNLVFHTINWPAQLIGYDENINLPTNVFVNKFVFLEGKKVSKSKNWFIKTSYFLENYPVDAVRFYLTFYAPEQKQLNFTWRDFIETNNKTLVGVIGNFIHRVLVFSQKNFGNDFKILKEKLSSEIIKKVEETFEETASHFEKGEFRFATQKIVELATFGNQYIDEVKIWELTKEDKKKAVSNVLLIVDSLRKFLYPLTPQGSEKLNKLLGYKKVSLEKGGWSVGDFPKEINFISEINPIFEKIDEKNIEIERKKLNDS